LETLKTRIRKKVKRLKINRATLDLVKKWEGLYLKAYQDAVNKWTIGWGITSDDKDITGTTIRKGMIINEDIAEKWLKESLEKKYLPKVMKYDDIYHWNENEAGALTSFAYNVGSIDQLTAYGTRSKEMIADKLLLYKKAGGKVLKGLLDRRKDERKLFLTPCEPQAYKGSLPALPERGHYKMGDGYLQNPSYKPNIKLVQKALNWALDEDIAVDGCYGGDTAKLVRRFQKAHGLEENGCFGKLCLNKLREMKK